MTVDVRAKVFCNLGTVIQASIADEAITAQQGLIRCRGQVILNGISTPSVGSKVFFGWERDGTIARIPRTLRVLSSFANPLTRQTTVQLGDKLTYLANLKGAKADPTNEDNESGVDPGPTFNEGDQCFELGSRTGVNLFGSRNQANQLTVNEQFLAAPASILGRAPLTIRASSVLDKCLEALGISSTGTELIAQFTQDSFDLSSGYVTVIDQLLANESLYGYLNEQEVLVIGEVENPAGSGPLLDENSIIQLDGINQGILPGQEVTVSFKSRPLTPADPLDPEPASGGGSGPGSGNPIEETRRPDDANIQFYENNWEYEENVVTGNTASFSVGNVTPISFSFNYNVTTETYTEYDDSDYVTKRTTRRTSAGADVIGSLIALQIEGEFGRSFVEDGPFTVSPETTGFATQEFVSETVDEFTYRVLQAPEEPSTRDLFCPSEDEEAEEQVFQATPVKQEKVLITQVSTTTEDPLAVLAKLNLSGVNWRAYRLSSLPSLGGPVVTDKVIINYELNQPTGQTKTTTERYTIYAQTIEGQQETAYRGQFANTTEKISANFSIATRLVYDTTEVAVRRDRTFGVQKRPVKSDLLQQAFGDTAPVGSGADEQNNTQEVTVGQDSSTIQTQPNLTVQQPFGSDDGFVWTASTGLEFSGSNAGVLAARYARAQNAILRGNRSGLQLQLPAYAMPLYPLSYVYVKAANATGGYRSNGMSWAMNAEGILCSMDALFWGGVGGSGTAWFPVAPGITSLPSNPTVTFGSGAPANATTTPSGFNPAAPGTIFTTLPTGQAPTYEQSIAPTALVPVVQERLSVVGATRAVIAATVRDYALTLPIASAALVTRAVVQNISRLLAAAAGFTTTGQTAGRSYTRKVKAGAGSFATAGFGAGSIRDYSIGTNAGAVVLTGASAKLKYQRKALTAEPTALVLTGQAAQFLKGISLKADGTTFVSSGFAAALTAARRLVGTAGSFSLTGQDAGGGIVEPSDEFFSSVQLLLKGEGTNGGSTITDSSSNNRSVATNSGAVTSTAQFKYGAASLYFDATTTTTQRGFTYTVSSGSTFGTGDYTIELFVRFSAISRVYRIFAIDTGSGVLTTDTSNNIRWLGSVFTPSPALAANTWYHLAAVRSSSSVKVYLDGTQIGSTVTSTANHTGTTWWVGRDFDADTGLYGYIDELRITKGVARYTANFTPPTKTFPVQ